MTEQPLYQPSFSWGRGLLVDESDVIGDWVDGEITSEDITEAFRPRATADLPASE